jgi:hypothetical protein
MKKTMDSDDAPPEPMRGSVGYWWTDLSGGARVPRAIKYGHPLTEASHRFMARFATVYFLLFGASHDIMIHSFIIHHLLCNRLCHRIICPTATM